MITTSFPKEKKWFPFLRNISLRLISAASLIAIAGIAGIGFVSWSSYQGVATLAGHAKSGTTAVSAAVEETIAEQREALNISIKRAAENMNNELVTRMAQIGTALKRVDLARSIQSDFSVQVTQFKNVVIYGFNEDHRKEWYNKMEQAADRVALSAQKLVELLEATPRI